MYSLWRTHALISGRVKRCKYNHKLYIQLWVFKACPLYSKTSKTIHKEGNGLAILTVYWVGNAVQLVVVPLGRTPWSFGKFCAEMFVDNVT
jgi:hypothetical protein